MGTPRLDRLDKNFLINGNMDFWQRNITFPAGNLYTADRWWKQNSVNTTATRVAITGVPGAKYALRMQATNATNAGYISQSVEDVLVNKLKGKMVTFSCWLSRHATFNTGLSMVIRKNATANQNFQVGAFISIASLAITAPIGTFQKYSLSVLVPDDGTANGLLCSVEANNDATNGSYWDIAQTSLLLGSHSPEGLVMAGRDWIDELHLCIRYFEKSWALEVPVGTSGDTKFYTGISNAGGQGAVNEIRYIAEKRSVPLISYWNGGVINTAFFRRSATDGTTTLDVNSLSNSKGFSPVNVTTIGAFVVFQLGFGWSADAEF